MTTRVAVIGCGYFARYHLAAWQKLAADGVELVAVCDVDPEKARDAAAETGASAYTDVGTMLDETKPDLVDIVTRMDTHVALVKQCAERGVAMIVQKPLAPTWADAVEIVETARRAGVFLAVHENFRYQAAMLRVSELIDAGAIGTPNWARIAFRTGVDVYRNQPYFYDETRLVILDLGIHLLDLARVFMGEVETVYCQTQRRNPRVKAEDTATIMLRHASGATSMVESTYEARRLPLAMAEAFVEIEGTEGAIVIDRQLQLTLTSREQLSHEDLVPADFDHTDPAAYVARQSVHETCAQILRAYEAGRSGRDLGRRQPQDLCAGRGGISLGAERQGGTAMSADFAVIVSFTVKSGDRQRFMALLRDNARVSMAQESGCHRFDILEPPQRPDEVWLYEIYADRAAFDVHLGEPHFLSFDAETRDMITGKAVIAARLEEGVKA